MGGEGGPGPGRQMTRGQCGLHSKGRFRPLTAALPAALNWSLCYSVSSFPEEERAPERGIKKYKNEYLSC